MEELIKKLLASDILTEDTSKQLVAAFNQQLEEAVNGARQQAVLDVTAELQSQWVAERDALIEALDTQVTRALEAELSELKEDISSFRDLEVEYADRVVSEKKRLAESLEADFGHLVEALNTFVEIRLTSELSELHEDIQEARTLQFGRRIYEAFQSEYQKFAVAGKDNTESQLAELKMQLEDTQSALSASESMLAGMQRAATLEKVLSPLSGRPREVMEAILKSVETPMLEDAYNTYIGRVLRESTGGVKTSEKETKVLAEGTKAVTSGVQGVAVTGDNKQQILREQQERNADQNSQHALSDENRYRLRRQAGII